MKLWNPLQKGQTMEFEGKVYTPDMVLGPSEKRAEAYLYDGHEADEIHRGKCGRLRPFHL